MNETIFLAQLWGPVIVAVALGIFVSRAYYIKIYRDIEKNTLAGLVFGIVAMTAGIAHVLYHNVWNTLPEIIISILGWGILIKGLLFLVLPDFVDRAGDGWVKRKMIPFAGGLMLVLGAYLTWIAYLG